MIDHLLILAFVVACGPVCLLIAEWLRIEPMFSNPTTIKQRTHPFGLAEIVRTRDLVRLETFCLNRTYRQVQEQAKSECVDLAELEELLWELS